MLKFQICNLKRNREKRSKKKKRSTNTRKDKQNDDNLKVGQCSDEQLTDTERDAYTKIQIKRYRVKPSYACFGGSGTTNSH